MRIRSRHTKPPTRAGWLSHYRIDLLPALTSTLAVVGSCDPGMPQAIPAVDELVLKGTHNSYDQRRKVTVERQVEGYVSSDW
jgi:hypothetical protein